MKFGIDELRFGLDYLKNIALMQTDRGLYLSLAELSRRHAQITGQPGEAPDPLGLTAYELRTFSQNGEDGVIAEILRRIGAPGRFFVEFGVESGLEGNSVYLADVAGWQGLFMEADDGCFTQLQRKYIAQDRVQTVKAMVTPENIEGLLEAAGVPLEPDVLSIDVDGQDYWIWEAITHFRPRLLMVEYNAAIDVRRRLVQPRGVSGWDRTAYYGASLASLRELGERKDYRLVHTELSAINAFFVREDLAGDAFPEASEVPVRAVPNFFGRGHHHRPPRAGRQYLDLDTGQLVDAER